MRRSTNAMIATLAVVCLVTMVAVAIALVRYEGEGQDADHGAESGEARSAPDPNPQHAFEIIVDSNHKFSFARRARYITAVTSISTFARSSKRATT